MDYASWEITLVPLVLFIIVLVVVGFVSHPFFHKTNHRLLFTGLFIAMIAAGVSSQMHHFLSSGIKESASYLWFDFVLGALASHFIFESIKMRAESAGDAIDRVKERKHAEALANEKHAEKTLKMRMDDLKDKEAALASFPNDPAAPYLVEEAEALSAEAQRTALAAVVQESKTRQQGK